MEQTEDFKSLMNILREIRKNIIAWNKKWTVIKKEPIGNFGNKKHDG